VSGIAKVVGVFSSCGAGACGGRDGNDTDVFAVTKFVAREWELNPRKITAAASAANHNVGVTIRHLQLLLSLYPDNGLVHQNMVQDASGRVLCIVAAGGKFHRFTNGDTEAARVIRVFRQNCAACRCFILWAGYTSGAERLHHSFKVRYLAETDFDHVDLDLDLEVEQGARKCER
jgi:hypothetical protein